MCIRDSCESAHEIIKYSNVWPRDFYFNKRRHSIGERKTIFIQRENSKGAVSRGQEKHYVQNYEVLSAELV